MVKGHRHARTLTKSPMIKPHENWFSGVLNWETVEWPVQNETHTASLFSTRGCQFLGQNRKCPLLVSSASSVCVWSCQVLSVPVWLVLLCCTFSCTTVWEKWGEGFCLSVLNLFESFGLSTVASEMERQGLGSSRASFLESQQPTRRAINLFLVVFPCRGFQFTWGHALVSHHALLCYS